MRSSFFISVCLLAFFAATIIPYSVLAQKTSKKYIQRFSVVANASRYFDDPDIFTRYHKLPDYYKIYNTVGASVGLQYEVDIYKNLSFGAGLRYGIRPFRTAVNIDLSTFDPMGSNDLSGRQFNLAFKHNVAFLSPKIQLTYRYNFKGKYCFVSTLGSSIRLFYNGNVRDTTYYEVSYWSNSRLYYVTVPIGSVYHYYGRDPNQPKSGFLGPNRFPYVNSAFEFAFGLENKLAHTHGRYIGLALEGSVGWVRGPEPNSSSYEFTNHISIFPRYKSQAISDRTITLGLRFTVGLQKQ